jgi:DNA-binding CsgD family transcriptional regulator
MAISSNVADQGMQRSEAIRTLLRALIGIVGDTPERIDDCSDQVLMDTDCDGQRYLLIRMPGIERNAAPLSPREIEIVRLVAEGHPNKVIANVLEISSWTVCTHLRRVFAKLGVTSRAAMVARMGEFGAILEIARAPASAPGRTGRTQASARSRCAATTFGLSPTLQQPRTVAAPARIKLVADAI